MLRAGSEGFFMYCCAHCARTMRQHPPHSPGCGMNPPNPLDHLLTCDNLTCNSAFPHDWRGFFHVLCFLLTRRSPCVFLCFTTPPPSPCNPPPLQSPHPRRPSLHCFARQYLLRWFVLPVCHTRPCIAFPSFQISHLCVFCDSLSPKAVYGVSCCFSRPKMFSPGDRVWYHSRTRGAHVLATVVGPSPKGPQFCHIWYICPGGSLKWIIRALNSQGSRPWQLHHPSL